jgi:hypothetical protein
MPNTPVVQVLLSTKEQSKLVDVVDAAFRAEGLTLSDMHLLFVTNRDSLVMSLATPTSKN